MLTVSQGSTGESPLFEPCLIVRRIYLISPTFSRPPGSNAHKWFKFDDGEVTEAKMDDDEVCASWQFVRDNVYA